MITKDNAKWVLPLVQALAEGKQLQMKINDKWRDVTEARFANSHADYRIKPEPRVMWVHVREGRAARFTADTETEDHCRRNGWTKFVEVID